MEPMESSARAPESGVSFNLVRFSCCGEKKKSEQEIKVIREKHS